MTKRRRRYPELLATRFSPGDEGYWVVEVWCPFCRHPHTHSAAGGHRVAHCYDKASPFMEGGYVLVAPKALVKALPESERADWRGYTKP